jgi:uncharacterized lipoprotein YmbA
MRNMFRRVQPNVLRRAAIVSILLSPIASCVRGTVPARELYRLRPTREAAAATPTSSPGDGLATAPAADDIISVEPYTTPGVYGDPQIVYREGETRYGTYPNREWALPLGTMLAGLTMETLRTQPGLAGRVQDGEPSGARRGLRWRGTVREFDEVDRAGLVFAAVRLDARLVRAADDFVLWSGTARAEGQVAESKNMTAVVDSLSSLAATAISRLARDAQPAVRGAARLNADASRR